MDQKISVEQAQEMLQTVEQTADQTRKAIASSGGGLILIVWGLIWMLSYIGTEFLIRSGRASSGKIMVLWWVTGSIGVALTSIIVGYHIRTGYPTRSAADKKINRRIGAFWGLLYLFAFIWLMFVKPANGIQLNAFLVTVIMFAFVVIGIWTDARYLLWLGLTVTALTLIGYFVIPLRYYNVWMAPTAGAALLGTGLYMYLRWRS